MQPAFISQSLSSSLAKRETDSETALYNWAKKRGLAVRRASREEDMRDHIDFHLSANGASISVDIKGNKEGQGLILVEMQNVQGRKGWVFGKADYILFQEGEEFLVIDRQKLADKVESVKEWKRGPKFCRAPFYYARKDRPNEACTWLPRSEVEKMKESFD